MKVKTVLLVLLLIQCNSLSAQYFIFEQHAIDLNFTGIHRIQTVDLDGDGDLDIVGGSQDTPNSQSIGIAWLRNDGGDPITWTRIPVDPSFDHVMSVHIADLNSDTYPDIIATSWNMHQIAWWENSGDPETGWARRIIRAGFTNAHGAVAADINEDGYLDVAGISSTPGEVIVCYHDGNDPPGWDFQTLSSTFAGGKSLVVLDIDDDGDLDIVGTASDANAVSWWEHGDGDPASWTVHVITDEFPGAGFMDVIDLNGDGLYDVIASSWQINEVAYWICEDLEAGQWQKTTVTDQMGIPASVRGRDLNLDGLIDIVAVGYDPGVVNIYMNDNFTWTRRSLEQNFTGGTGLSLHDLDGDGDCDIIACASGLGDLYWWEYTGNTSVGRSETCSPERFHLFQNYPNPFNPETTISFLLEESLPVSVRIFDVSGRCIRCLNTQRLSPGLQQITWDGRDNFGNPACSGVYHCLVQAGIRKASRKMLLIR